MTDNDLRQQIERAQAEAKMLRQKTELPKHTNSLPITNVPNGIKPYVKVDVIPVPEGATNGDVVQLMFPNLRVTICSEAKPTPYVMVMGENYEFNLTFPLDWWNATYKKEEDRE